MPAGTGVNIVSHLDIAGESNLFCCRFLEVWMDCPILWLACRRHIAELHTSHASKAITGATKDPGVALFRRLKDQWYGLKINYDELVKWDFGGAPSELQEVASEVLTWAQAELKNGTFPRDDYKELIELLVVSLGGEVKGFTFKLPGPDHNARWMAKRIYYLKLKLVSKVFAMSVEEMNQVNQMAEYVILFDAKNWFVSPLPASAARHDLDFMSSIIRYRTVNPKASYAVLGSCYRHLWYITPQLITLALVDTGLEAQSRDEMAKALFSNERSDVKSGKPIFPVLSNDPIEATETCPL